VIPNEVTTAPPSFLARTVTEPVADVLRVAVSAAAPKVAFEPVALTVASPPTAVHEAGPVIDAEPVPADTNVSTAPLATTVPELIASPDVSTTHTPRPLTRPLPAVSLIVTSPFAMVAADAGATDVRTPSPSAATATSATRLKFVFVDMFFLSLVEIGHFPISARSSFELLIPYLL